MTVSPTLFERHDYGHRTNNNGTCVPSRPGTRPQKNQMNDSRSHFYFPQTNIELLLELMYVHLVYCVRFLLTDCSQKEKEISLLT